MRKLQWEAVLGFMLGANLERGTGISFGKGIFAAFPTSIRETARSVVRNSVLGQVAISCPSRLACGQPGFPWRG